jgi:hypothetical protein
LSRVNIFGESPRALGEEGFGESKKKKFSAKIKTLGEEFLRRESKIFFAERKKTPSEEFFTESQSIGSRRRISSLRVFFLLSDFF